MKEKYISFCKKHKSVLVSIIIFLVIANGLILFVKLRNANSSVVSGKDLTLSYDGKIFIVKKRDVESQTFLNLKLLEIGNSINIDATPITPDFKGDISKTIPQKDGIIVNTDKLTILIAENIKRPPLYPLAIPVLKTFAGKYSEEDLNKIRAQAVLLLKDPLTITTKGINFTLTPDDFRSMLVVKEKPDPRNPKKMMLVLRLDETLLDRKLGDYAQKVENAVHSEYNYHQARVVIYSQFFGNYRKLVEVPTGATSNLSLNVLGTATESAITNGAKKVYLTFDDGPNSLYHPMILDILKRYSVKATFFLVGKNSQANLDIVKRTLTESHKIGNHSFTHPFLPQLTNAGIFNEISQTDEILKNLIGTNITMFRPPYGGINLYVKQAADSLHLKLFLWDVDPRDWSEPPVDELVRRVVSNTKDGSDILLHSNHLVTVQALPKIIETLQAQGYTFDTLN